MTSRLTLRRVGRWTGIVLLGLVALIMWLAASGAAYEAIMAAGDDERYPARGQRVDVGDYRLHIHCVGEGSPTVVLDAGAGWVFARLEPRATGTGCNNSGLRIRPRWLRLERPQSSVPYAGPNCRRTPHLAPQRWYRRSVRAGG